MTIFKSRIKEAILNEQKALYSLDDVEQEKVFINYNKKNNRRYVTKRCVKNFKKYCKDILKL